MDRIPKGESLLYQQKKKRSVTNSQESVQTTPKSELMQHICCLKRIILTALNLIAITVYTFIFSTVFVNNFVCS